MVDYNCFKEFPRDMMLTGVQEFRDFIDDTKSIHFKLFLNIVETLPCSSAQSGYGFSLNDNILTNLKSSLLISNASSLIALKFKS